MTRRIIVLESAKEDFKDIQRYVKQNFGVAVWHTVHAEYRDAFRRIQQAPQIGTPIELLADLGMSHVRTILVRQTRLVYEFDDSLVIVHLFIGTRQDFRAHLLKRLLRC